MADLSHILPARNELFHLHRWALVAFTIRCAQRAFPILEQSITPPKHAKNAAKAVHAAITALAQGDVANATIFDVRLTAPHPGNMGDAVFLFDQLWNVLKTAFEISKAAARDDVDGFDDYTAFASSYASYVSWTTVKIAGSDKQLVAEAIRKDFESLRIMFAGRLCNPENGFAKGIDIKLLGPLWPNGTPDWYYESRLLNPNAVDIGAFQTLPMLELYFEPGTASKEALQRVMEALSRLHIAYGGAGLNFQPGDGFLYAREHVKV